MDFQAIVLGTIGICLYLLIPGLAVSLAIFPRKSDINFAERLGLSTFLGMLVPAILYFNNENLIIPVNSGTTLATLGAVTLLSLIIWQLRLRTPGTQAASKTA